MILRVRSEHKLAETESLLRRALQHHGAQLHEVTRLGRLLPAQGRQASHDALTFTVCHNELYTALLSADIRFAVFLPFRIAAWTDGDGTMIEAMSPRESCRILNRTDLDRLVLPLESLIREVIEATAKPAPAHPHPSPHTNPWALGATEEQVNVKGSIPQRIDKRGTKVEELAGTGTHDSSGG